jgi:hypothetical protein
MQGVIRALSRGVLLCHWVLLFAVFDLSCRIYVISKFSDDSVSG